jgi:chemotaxis protein CheC
MGDKSISNNQTDLIRELATMGAGRAATALSEMIRTKVDITLPEIKMIPIEELKTIFGPEKEEVFFVLDTKLKGDVNGRISFLISTKQAKNLSSVLIGKDVNEIKDNDPFFQSSLKEVINIVVGGYVAAISDLADSKIMYTVPYMAQDMIGSLLDFLFIQIAQYTERLLFIKTNMKIKNIDFDCFFLFFPDEESLRKLFKTLGV